jgi:hypothetical protein
MLATPSLYRRANKVSFDTVKRTFFASSTDHTTLVANAKIHRVGDDKYGKRTYILIPDGTDIDLALKVDKLHLGRIFADKNYIYGAKVVQRSLGSHSDVCKRLLDMALEDSMSQGEDPVALASLHGLSRWLVEGIEGKNEIALLNELKNSDEKSFEACKAIATGIPRAGHSVVGQGTYRDAESAWRNLANEYVVSLKMSDEANLYQENDAKLVGIDHLADTSKEGMMGAGGSMARFIFNS